MLLVSFAGPQHSPTLGSSIRTAQLCRGRYMHASGTAISQLNSILVSSPDLIRHVYYFQYNAHDTESDLRWGWFWIWD